MGIQTVSQALSNENVAPFGFKNRIINGNFDIWQRGTSFSNPNDTYTADRFLVVPGGGTTGDTVSQQTFTPGQTDVPGEPTYFLRFAVGATSANRVMHHRVEDVRTFAGQTCTLSFYAKASTAHTSSVEFSQNFGSGGSTAVTQSAIAYTMSTSWQKFTFTVTLPSIAGKTIGTSSYLYVAFIRSLPASSVNIDIAQMQFEKGPQATAFDARPYTTELQLCQRYCFTLVSNGSNASSFMGVWRPATSSMLVVITFPVVMRASPSGSIPAGSSSWGTMDGLNPYTGTPTLGAASPYSITISIPTSTPTFASGYGLMALMYANAGSICLLATAEL
jgi:hypothetical protein